jgi:hypothetical protein
MKVLACLTVREFFYGALKFLTGMPSNPSNVPRQIIAPSPIAVSHPPSVPR